MKTITCLLLSLFITGTLFSQHQTPAAQKSFSESDLETFVEAVQEIMQMQQVAELRIMSFIEENDLDLETFNALYLAKLEEGRPAPEVNPEQQAAFDEIVDDVMAMQNAIQDEAMDILDEKGLEIDVYTQMMAEYQQNPEFQQRVNEMLINGE